MNYKKIRDTLTCNQKAKQQLFESGYLNKLSEILKTYLQDKNLEIEELTLHFEIIAMLGNSKNKNIIKKLKKETWLYFKCFQACFSNEGYETFKHSLEILNNESIEDSVTEEIDVKYYKYDWASDPKTKYNTFDLNAIYEDSSESPPVTFVRRTETIINRTVTRNSRFEILNASGERNLRRGEDNLFDIFYDNRNGRYGMLRRDDIHENSNDHTSTTETSNDNGVNDIDSEQAIGVNENIELTNNEIRNQEINNYSEPLNYSDDGQPHVLDNVNIEIDENSRFYDQNGEENEISLDNATLNQLLQTYNETLNSGVRIPQRYVRRIANLIRTNSTTNENLITETIDMPVSAIQPNDNEETAGILPNDDLLQTLVTHNHNNEIYNLFHSTDVYDENGTNTDDLNSLSAGNHNLIDEKQNKDDFNNSVLVDQRINSNNQIDDNEKIKDNDSSSQICINLKNEEHDLHILEKQQYYLSILRCFKKMISLNTKPEKEVIIYFFYLLINEPLKFLHIKIQKDLKSEICTFIKKLLRYKEIRDIINSFNFINYFEVNEENAVILLELVNKNNYNSIDSANFESLFDNYNSKYFINSVDLYIKWIEVNKEQKGAHYRIVLKILDKLLSSNTNEALFLLGRIAHENEEVQKLIYKMDICHKIVEIFNELYFTETSLTNIMFCLYSLTGNWEENRKYISKKKIIANVFEIFKGRVRDKKYDKTFLMLISFLRSMTKCVRFLRADLLEYPIVELLLITLEKLKNSKGGIEMNIIDLIREETNNERQLCSFMIIKESLCVLANLILDYGNYKFKFLKKRGLKLVFKIGKKKNLEFYHFFLCKNFVFESSWHIKERLIAECKNKIIKNKVDAYSDLNSESDNNIFEKRINIDDIIENINYAIDNNKSYIEGNLTNTFLRLLKKHNRVNTEEKNMRSKRTLKTLKEFFNLIRNMVCANIKEINYFFSLYPLLLENIILSFIKCLKGNLFTDKKKAIIELIYIFSNICASGKDYKKIFMNDKILIELKKICEIKDRTVIIPFIWLLTNLSWNEDDDGNERVEKLTFYGFKDYLNEIRLIDPYVNDKVVTAMDNLEI